MSRLRVLALLALLAGLALLGYGLAQGTVRVGLFLIVPFVYGTGLLPAMGVMLLMAAAVLWMLGSFSRLERVPLAPGDATTERRSSHGGVVLLGPIPIVWGSDRRVLPWMVAAGAALLLLALAFTWATR